MPIERSNWGPKTDGPRETPGNAVVSSFFRTLILAERQLDRAQAVVLLI